MLEIAKSLYAANIDILHGEQCSYRSRYLSGGLRRSLHGCTSIMSGISCKPPSSKLGKKQYRWKALPNLCILPAVWPHAQPLNESTLDNLQLLKIAKYLEFLNHYIMLDSHQQLTDPYPARLLTKMKPLESCTVEDRLLNYHSATSKHTVLFVRFLKEHYTYYIDGTFRIAQ